jgi:methyl-accepting chemotaxis protein
MDGKAERIKAVKDIREGFGKYLEYFSAMSKAKQQLGLDENSGLEGKLRASVHAIETKLKEFNESELLVSMLMMRRHEKDFMLRRDVKYGVDIKKRGAEFTATLDKTDIPDAGKADLKKKLADYQRDFSAWVDAAVVMANEQKATSAAYAGIEPVLDTLKKSIEMEAAEVSALSQKVSADTTLQMEIAIGAVAFLVLGFAVWIGRSVSKPIASMARIMEDLAQGNMQINVPGEARTDEIGQMAGAVLIFKKAGIERVRLEKVAQEQRKEVDEQRQQADIQRAQAEEQRQLADDERRKNTEAQAKAAEEQFAAAQAQVRAAETQAQAVKALAAGLSELAQGNLTVRLDEGFSGEYQKIKDDFNGMADQLQETITAIAASALEVTNAAAEISTSTTSLSQRTEEQAAGLEETSASMEEVSATVRKNAENASHANKLTAGAGEVADHGGAVVAKAVDAMSRIEESSRKITDIIGVIDEIARQTNLLALNAAVEAARAGDAGRGFAVVASEVRSLAQRSSQAAKDIKDLISNSTAQVQDGVDLVNRTGASLGDIVKSIKEVAALIADIATASAEQATGLDQVNKALVQMDELTQQNSALVEENAATAKTLEGQSTAMSDRLGYFRLEAASAKATVQQRRAAA